MPNESFTTVLWLLPVAREREILRSFIGRLAQECDAPIFEPHLTLGLGTSEMLDQFPRKAFRLRVTALAFSPSFTKTLFVRLKASAELNGLRQSLCLKDATPFDPHLSLLYCDLPEARLARLAQSIELPFTSMLFDAAAAIRCPNPTASRDDVESWQVIASAALC